MLNRFRAVRLGAAVLSLMVGDAVVPLKATQPGTLNAPVRTDRQPLGARRGRPRKFAVPSRAVTLTLPEHVIATLQGIDPDLSMAVARLTESSPAAAAPLAELATHGNRGIILVPQNRALKIRTGAELVPLSNGRALILLDERQTAAEFELRLRDALADPALTGIDRALFEKVAEILRGTRQNEGVEILERSLIVVQWKQARAARTRRQRRAHLTG